MVANITELRLPECIDSGLLRMRYFQRQLLTVDDMQTDQDYFRAKQRRHNRHCHGWGSVCGLEVVPDSTIEAPPWQVQIAEGYALGPYGDEIYVTDSIFLDLAQCGPGATTDPCEPGLLRRPSSSEGQQVFVAIKYAECVARPVRAMPAGCACDEEACEYSRIRDSFQIECLPELPPSHQPQPGPTLCDIIQGRQLPVCPPCPSEPWVVLAQVNLPASRTTEITADMIDNFTFRRQVFSTAVLQNQLIACCCGEADLEITTENTDNDTIAEGARFTLEIQVTNHGPSFSQNIIITDVIHTDAGQVLRADGTVTSHGEWTISQLSEPSSDAHFQAEISRLLPEETATLVLIIDVSGTHHSLSSTVTVSSDTFDSNLANNTRTIRFPVAPDPELPVTGELARPSFLE